MKNVLSAALIAMSVLIPSASSAQGKSDVALESQRKLSALFATLGLDKTCPRSGADSWECSFRGRGLRQISVRAVLVHEDVLRADVVTVTSTFAMLSDFPNTRDFYLRLLKFNTERDFAKLIVLDDGRIVIVAGVPVRLLDKEELVHLLDRVAAANNEASNTFGKGAKH